MMKSQIYILIHFIITISYRDIEVSNNQHPEIKKGDANPPYYE